MTTHSVIHTGGNIYNDYICDFDKSGRVIVVSEGGIRLFTNDRDYQLGIEPICWASSREAKYKGIPCEEDSYIADLEVTTTYTLVIDIDGAGLMVHHED